MLNFLPETIKTFSENSQRTVGSLIRDIKVDKSQVAELVKNLSNFSSGPTFIPRLSTSRELINSEFFVDFFRDFEIRFSRFFDATNSINTVVNSMTEIMLSQIAKAEKTIAYYENYVNNYEFISGKDDLYNFSYIENFDNNLNSNEYDSEKVPYVDRGGLAFSENGNGYVDPVSSKFKIGSGIKIINVIDNIKDVKTTSNYRQYVSNQSNADSLFNEDDSDTWSVSIKSPVIITSGLEELSKYIDYDYSYIVGAKTIMEISFLKETEMDLIRISPNESNGLQLMQIAVESSNVVEKTFSLNSDNPVSGYQLKKLLKQPIIINSTIDVNIPLDKVKKIILIFNQSTYTKSNNPSPVDELVSRSISDYATKIKRNRKNNYSALQDIVIEYFRRDSSLDELKRNEYSHTDYYTCKFPIYNKNHPSLIETRFVKENNNLVTADDEDRMFANSPLTMLVQNIVSQALGARMNVFKDSLFRDTQSSYAEVRLGDMVSAPSSMSKNSNMLGYKNLENYTDQIIPGSKFGRTPLHNNNFYSINNYEYSFSIRNIQFGKSAVAESGNKSLSLSKACYISKKIEIPGDVYGIKAKINLDQNKSNYNSTAFDLEYENSYELSISAKENPTKEEDWIAIASYDLDQIDSEILFVDPVSLSAKLRFYPNYPSLKVYENQKLLSENNYSLNKFDRSIIIKTFNKSSTYVASYSLDNKNYSQNYIDLSVLSDQIRINPAGKDGGEGEFFKGTSSENKVLLKNYPFIDVEKTNKATYSRTFGTIVESKYFGYSPVIVKFDDGSYAINLTNYLDGDFEKADFYNTSEILFFQNGKNLIFNKTINKSFNVIYNYMNNYLRFRLIMRNNYANSFSSGCVDNVIVKMKTKSPDINIQKLLKLG